MERSFRSELVLLLGIGLFVAALVLQFIFYETLVITVVLGVVGVAMILWGGYGARAELSALLRRRRSEVALYTLGVIGIMIAVGYLSVRYPLRFDMTQAGLHSLSKDSIAVLERLERPVQVVFFHNHLMEKTVNLYRLIAAQTDKVTVEFHDPTLNPARARMLNVRFPGTAVMSNQDRRVDVNGDQEADIINGILRVSQGVTQHACFLDGHGEADPFSKESHDHLEAAAAHSHGTGVQYVLHETHGLAKARKGLEELNYTTEKISLLQGGADQLEDCSVLIVAGPRSPVLPGEVETIRAFLAGGGNALFMLEPFIETGLEPVMRDYGVNLEPAMVIDPSHHFAADPSSPAVTDYNYHQMTRDLPLTFFPGVQPLSPAARVAGVSVTPVINSSPNSFGETSRDRAERDDATDLPGPLTLMVAVNKRPPNEGEHELIATLERNAPSATDADATPDEAPRDATDMSRVVIIGDADFATNSFFHILGNGNLFLNTVNYLAAQENLIGIEPHTRELPEINFTNRQMKATFFVAVFFFSAALGPDRHRRVVAPAVTERKRRTRSLTIWLLLAVFVAGIFVAERQGWLDPDSAVDEHGHAKKAKMLLPVGVEQINAIEITVNDVVHRFERDADGAWFHHHHDDAQSATEPHDHKANPANAELIAQALGVLGRTRIAREVGTGVRGEDYGVTTPELVFAIFGANQEAPLARYMVGDLEPDGFRRYVLIFGAFSIVTIPDYQVENLRQLVAAFQQPPA